jgi:hypothetical protein
LDITPYIPVVIAEATKFVFHEAKHWISEARKQVKKTPSPKPAKDIGPCLTEEEFTRLSVDPQNLLTIINKENAQALEYEIQGLVEMIRIHRKNFIDYEKAEALQAELTPPYIRRGIEREAEAIIEKEERLRELLESVYGKQLANS